MHEYYYSFTLFHTHTHTHTCAFFLSLSLSLSFYPSFFLLFVSLSILKSLLIPVFLNLSFILLFLPFHHINHLGLKIPRFIRPISLQLLALPFFFKFWGLTHSLAGKLSILYPRRINNQHIDRKYGKHVNLIRVQLYDIEIGCSSRPLLGGCEGEFKGNRLVNIRKKEGHELKLWKVKGNTER